ncbi:hypothetical protein [Salarchaeum sp. JOR-1]|uniref:hypothetical protein n=1 Tax=Salarchaeum sp. JOR-1 TaxID=2599399 RepID=UPI00119875BA|nr:hypothetical protein [Salarchaeum sp. JOR-1]QDX41581.1 hypothetical protein FQU85_11955 [Salarchaeum sp. JOR-1]
MQRRALLTATGAAATVALAGCSAFGTGGDQYAHFLTLYNSSDTEYAVAFDIAAGDGTTLFEKPFDLDPGAAHEHVTFDGAPASVTVRVGDESPRTLDWPTTERCRERNTAGKPGLELRIMQPTEARPAPNVYREWTCESVEPE